jgi:hypothetical protein
VLPWILAITNILKHGGTQRSCIDIITKLGLTLSSTLYTSQLKSTELEMFHNDRMIKFRQKVLETDTEGNRKYIVVGIFDNYNWTQYSKENTPEQSKKGFTHTIDSLTIITQLVQKHNQFYNIADKAQACTPFTNDNIDEAVIAIMRGNIDFLEIMKDENGNPVIDTKSRRLSDFITQGSVPVKR